jgi:hypothetical protein
MCAKLLEELIHLWSGCCSVREPCHAEPLEHQTQCALVLIKGARPIPRLGERADGDPCDMSAAMGRVLNDAAVESDYQD